MIRALCSAIFLLPLASNAQFTYRLDSSIPVTDIDGRALPLPWAGGLNAAQFNTMDLDGDGREDLVLFDRMAHKVITFLADEDRYVPAPAYEGLFPDGVSNWLLLRDYDCDGRKDIFTGDVLGVKVYRNVTDGDVLAWEPHLFETGYDGAPSPVIMTKNPATGIRVNLQLQFDDLPSIGDIDGDGDFDIVNVQYMGHTLEFHRNMQVEEGLPCGDMSFTRVTRTWGGLRECHCGVFAFNGQSCPPDAGRVEHAGGKSLLVQDLNGDDAPDILFSEADCTLLYALINKGTAHAPVFDSFSSFPPGQPVNFVLFPAAFYEDVTFDGRKDLIATPNLFSKEYLNSLFDRSTWMYENTGTDEAPAFTLVQRNFLQGDMIDVGDNAVPTFFDYDGDGDNDMLISSHASPSYTGRIHLFENTGSDAAPVFRHTDDDFLGFDNARFYNLKIQFADLDANGTSDLIFTATSFDDGGTRLYAIHNQSPSRLDLSGASLTTLPFALTQTENVLVADISGDGLPDILAGRSEGNLAYWKNTGIAGSPAWTLEEENYLGFGPTPLRQNLSATISDLDNDGLADLIVGDNTGRLTIISGFQSAPLPVQEIVYNPLLETYTSRNLGGPVWPTVTNLFNATLPAIVVGNHLGGVHVLRHDEGESLPAVPAIDLYPNPVNQEEALTLRVDRTCTMEVFSILGQQVSRPVILRPYQLHTYAVSSLSSGLYLMKFTTGGKSYTRRFVVE